MRTRAEGSPVRAALAALSSVFAAAGCSPDLPELEWFGRYVAFATDAPIRPCGGMLPRMDRFVGRIHELFDRTPSQEPISVYYLPDGWEPGFPCPADERGISAAGCASPAHRAVFFDAFSALDHELAHVVMVDIASYHAPLFEEGTAVALSDRPPLLPPRSDRVEDMVGWPAQAVDYVAAGYFVRSLIDRHGPDTFLEFYRDGLWGMSREDTLAKFERHFGEPLEEAAAHYRAREHQCYFELGVCDDEPMVPWQGDEWHYHRRPSCDEDDVWGFEPTEEAEEGSTFGSGSITVALELPADGHYEITPTVAAVLRRCGPTCEDHQELELRSYTWQRPYLRAGRYTLELRALFGSQDTDVVIRRSRSLTPPSPPAPDEGSDAGASDELQTHDRWEWPRGAVRPHQLR